MEVAGPVHLLHVKVVDRLVRLGQLLPQLLRVIVRKHPLVVAEEGHDVGHLVDLLVHIHQP